MLTPTRIAPHLTALVALIALTSMVASPAEAKKPKKGDTFSARVVRVIDGDSMVVQRTPSGNTTRINLAGIDAKGSADAQQYLHSLLFDTTVTVRVVSTKGVDSSADVSLNGSDVAESVVNAGLASSTGNSIQLVRRLLGVGRIARGILSRGSDAG
ncbi:MAG: hypothetical protein IH936_09300 [Acidobacteria bacterium]|nr:hypothetical protein [Acidobacteriota bacterium]